MLADETQNAKEPIAAQINLSEQTLVHSPRTVRLAAFSFHQVKLSRRGHMRDQTGLEETMR